MPEVTTVDELKAQGCSLVAHLPQGLYVDFFEYTKTHNASIHNEMNKPTTNDVVSNGKFSSLLLIPSRAEADNSGKPIGQNTNMALDRTIAALQASEPLRVWCGKGLEFIRGPEVTKLLANLGR